MKRTIGKIGLAGSFVAMLLGGCGSASDGAGQRTISGESVTSQTKNGGVSRLRLRGRLHLWCRNLFQAEVTIIRHRR